MKIQKKQINKKQMIFREPSTSIRTLVFLVFWASSALAFSIGCQRATLKPDASTAQAGTVSNGPASATPLPPAGPPIVLNVPPAPVTSQSVAPAAAAATTTAKPLTSLGENFAGRFSADGSKIVFISRLRANHPNAQIYEIELAKSTERRLTFHDGDDANPSYSTDGSRLLYASTTDEIKESDVAVNRLKKAYAIEPSHTTEVAKPQNLNDDIDVQQVYEIYEQNFQLREIRRATHSPGYDGEPDLAPKANRVVFVSGAKGASQIKLQTGRSAAALSDGKHLDQGPRFSPDGSMIVWSRAADEGSGPNSLIVATNGFRKTRSLLDSTSGRLIHPSWQPGGKELVFSSNMAGAKFNLYSIDEKGTCVRRLTDADFDQLHPSVSPDEKLILFTGIKDGRRQLYLMDYVKPKDCWLTPSH